jgi:hypothetical protein
MSSNRRRLPQKIQERPTIPTKRRRRNVLFESGICRECTDLISRSENDYIGRSTKDIVVVGSFSARTFNFELETVV